MTGPTTSQRLIIGKRPGEMMDDKSTMRANSTTKITHPMSYEQWLANAQAASSPAIAEAYRQYVQRCKTDPAYLT